MRDDSASLYCAIGITLPLATFALVARLYARRITKAGFWYDDTLAILGFMGTTAYTTVALVWTVCYGLGIPLSEGPKNLTEDERVEQGWLMLWCSSMTYTFGIAFCKFSILTFYWRIFKISGIRVPIQVLFGLTVAWFLLRIFMVTLQCIPITALWDKSITDANCSINESTFFFSTVLTHVIIDIAIVVLPGIEVRKLQLPLGQKLAVVALFTFGFLTCISSALVLVESLRFDSHSREVGLQMGLHTAWAVAEVNLAAVSTSLPMLRPIFRKLLPGSFLGSYGTGRTTGNATHASRSMKLATITRTRNRDIEDSSTHELAGQDTPSEFKGYNPDWHHGPKVVITSSKKYASSGGTDEFDQGIYVQNEMVVQREQV